MSQGRVQLGVIGRPHGVRGLVHVHSYTEDPAALPKYGPFSDARGREFTLAWHSEGVARVSELVNGVAVPVVDRSGAERLVNVKLYVAREQLPKVRRDEYYLADLIGLEAVAPDGTVLGPVATVHDYGAGASLEIGALLVPFTKACVPEVDIAARRLVVVPPVDASP